MISFAIYILAAISIQYTFAQDPPAAEPAQNTPSIPVCDGSQVVYASPSSIDPITGNIRGPGLDAITLSIDGLNTFITNTIGIASDVTELIPDQQPETEIIRSATINPLTRDLVLLYQEIDPSDPLQSEPRQRLIIIPGFKLNNFLIQSPGILGYEINDQIDLAETELGDEYPLTEIAFDCAGNLLGVTAKGELVQMIIEPGSSNLETVYIGPIEFEGGIVGLSQGFLGLTYDFQTNLFVAVGGQPVANTLVQFAVHGCDILQMGNPIIITDTYALCPLGIVDIESRGNNQYYVTCAISADTFGLAVLELQNGIASILPLNAAQGQTLVSLPNSSGGGLLATLPSGSQNAICFPMDMSMGTCNTFPAENNCEGDITIELVMPPPIGAAPGAGFGGITPPGQVVESHVSQGGVNGMTGVNVGAVNGQVSGIPQLDGGYVPNANGQEGGTYYTGYQGAQMTGVAGEYSNGGNGGYTNEANGANGANGANSNGESEFGGAEAVNVGAAGVSAQANSGSGSGSTESGSSSSSDSDDDSDGSDGDDDSDSDDSDSNDSDSDDDSDDSDDSDDDSDDDDNDDDDSDSDDDSDDSDDDGDDDSDDDDDDGDDDDDDSDDSDDDDGDSDDDDDGDDDSDDDDDDDDSDDSFDGDGDESIDDDDNEGGSAQDAQSYGNDFNENGFLAENGSSNNGEGTMISLSPTTLANLWGLAMIFLGINLTFLFICYYRNGNCRKNQITMDHGNDADIESL